MGGLPVRIDGSGLGLERFGGQQAGHLDRTARAVEQPARIAFRTDDEEIVQHDLLAIQQRHPKVGTRLFEIGDSGGTFPEIDI